MKKQTAVEYLIQYMMNNQYFVGNDLEDYLLLADVFEQAKAMEREQIMDAYDTNRDLNTIQTAEQYYNETYKGGEQ